MQSVGYSILRRADLLVDEYEKSDSALQNREHLAALRLATSPLNPRRYRGISRQPLEPEATRDLAIRQELEPAAKLGRNASARARFRKLVGFPEYDPEASEECLAKLEDAEEVFSLLETPEEYEIVLLEKDDSESHPLILGYDVGYWSGDHFSIIYDTLVAPLWHPPQPEDFQELAVCARELNDHVLFPTARLAAKFRQWYVSKPWAETESEPGEFCIIRVSGVVTAG